jgi:DNA-binding FadR family transcriptional regulator
MMLGVTRPTVSDVAAMVQRAGFITYRRGASSRSWTVSAWKPRPANDIHRTKACAAWPGRLVL